MTKLDDLPDKIRVERTAHQLVDRQHGSWIEDDGEHVLDLPVYITSSPARLVAEEMRDLLTILSEEMGHADVLPRTRELIADLLARATDDTKGEG